MVHGCEWQEPDSMPGRDSMDQGNPSAACMVLLMMIIPPESLKLEAGLQTSLDGLWEDSPLEIPIHNLSVQTEDLLPSKNKQAAFSPSPDLWIVPRYASVVSRQSSSWLPTDRGTS